MERLIEYIRNGVSAGLSNEEIEMNMIDSLVAADDEYAAHGDDHSVLAVSQYGPVNDAGERSY